MGAQATPRPYTSPARRLARVPIDREDTTNEYGTAGTDSSNSAEDAQPESVQAPAAGEKVERE
jgi:hypothetical protein